MPDDARFCSTCGNHLSGSGLGAPAIRKVVTVIFTDVAGFTPLTERVDQERLRGVMARYFEEMRNVVLRHGGVVEKFIGDAVMAVFGIPHLHEDDALRAVRAAVEMGAALGSLNRDLERQWGITLHAHTGINTGEVAVGAARATDAVLVGDSVNVAARLQQFASPSEILLGEDTYQLVKGAVEAEPLEPFALKGKDLPTRAFRLLRVTPGRPARTGRPTSPLVGRREELALLTEAFHRSEAERTCRLVTVLAPAGMGKSRLIAEFVKGVSSGATVLQGDCLPYGDAITYWPVTRVVAQAAHVNDDDSPENVQSKIALLVEADEDAELIVQRGGQVFGFGGLSTASDEVFWAVRKLLEALARDRPVVVILEDAHWAEPTLLDLIEHIVDWSRSSPILLLCLARPEFLTQRPGWGEGRPNASLIPLGPLPEQQSEVLIGNLLRAETVAPRAVQRINDAAQGNPLYIEELLSMLIGEGLLNWEGQRWIPATDLHEIILPPTIHTLLAARLDRMSPEDRQVIEVASVIGTEFDSDAILTLVSLRTDAQVLATLQALVGNEFVRTESGGSGRGGLRFHHVLLRDAAYNGISKEVRAELHERFADWLERSAGERLGEYAEILGHHLDSAYRYRRELRPVDDHDLDLARRAGERLAAAGSAAFDRGDMLAAESLLSRAVELLPPDHELRGALLPRLSEALMSTGQLERADAVLNDVFTSGSAFADQRLQAHIMLVRSVQRLFTPEGGAEAGRQEVTHAIPLFEQAGDELGLARAWRLLSIVHLAFLRFSDAEEAMDHAAAHAASAGDRRVELEALSWLPLFVWAGPARPDLGVHRCHEIVVRADGDPQVEANALMAGAAFEAMQGRFEEARHAAFSSRAILEDLGLRVSIAGPWAQLDGWIEFFAGDYSAAERALQLGYGALEQMGETGWLSTVAVLLAQALYAQGRYEEAERLTDRSEEITGPDDLYSQILIRSVRAKLYARRGETIDGERLSREAVQLANATDFLLLQGETFMDLAEVLQLAGRDDFGSAVRSAVRIYERKGSLVSVRRAEAKLQSLAGRESAIGREEHK
jgi:class 3 adenylate cyclase/tetratricopeptide (TPR) repeat protein